jgi:hypothetical protein
MSKTVLKPVALVVAFAVMLSMALTSGGNATSGPAALAPAGSTVAHNAKGTMTARVVGTAGNGRTVTGKFYPLKFRKNDGRIRVRGLLNGVVHNENGSTSTFSAMRTMRVKRINGVPVHARNADAASALACDILHLVLGPLDLDLLGLQVHLDRVRLDIVAVPGPGNLLGNLLCAVAGLLDGPLDGLLGRLTNLLNRILAVLRLGV